MICIACKKETRNLYSVVYNKRRHKWVVTSRITTGRYCKAHARDRAAYLNKKGL